MVEDFNQRMARLNEESELASRQARAAIAAMETNRASERDAQALAAARRQTREAIEGLRALSEHAERRRRSPLARLLGAQVTLDRDQAGMTAAEKVLLEQMNGHYAELRSDGPAWVEHVRERELWETTLLDGLLPE